MENCPNCQKEFTKRGMKNHLRCCVLKQNVANHPILVEEVVVPPPVPIPDVVVEPVLLTKTDAKKEYALNDRDLSQIPHIEKRNPRFRSAPNMCLYDVDDLENYAIAKYGSIEQMEEKKDKNANRGATTKINKQQKEETRRQELARALSAVNCIIRSDSRLCDAYIEKGEGNLQEIVRIMSEMKFYYDKTKYPQIMNRLIEDAKEARYEYGYQYDYDDLSQEAKDEAISEFGKNYKTEKDLPNGIPESLRVRIVRRLNGGK